MKPDSLDSWRQAKRVLAVRLDSIGDVLMTSPAFRALKQAGKEVTILTSPAGAAIAREIPEIDDVIIFEAPWMPNDIAYDQSREALSEMIEELRSRHFDAGIVFTVFSQNPLPAAMLLYEAGIPLRAAHCRENPYALLTDWIRDVDCTVPVDEVRHEVRRQLDLVAALGFSAEDEQLSVRVAEHAKRSVRRKLAHLGLTKEGTPWAVVHTGANAPSRRYNPKHFIAVIRRLQSLGWRIALTGSSSERETTRLLARDTGCMDLAGELDLQELIALIAEAPLLISNNSGPVHIAAAVGTPVVDIYALTNPQHTPWHVPHRVLNHEVACKNCFKSICPLGHQDCIDKVEPQSVVAAAQHLLHDTRFVNTPLPLLHRSTNLPIASYQ